MENRTDLALESYENQRKTVLPGVKVREQDGISVVEVLDARGEKALGKPVVAFVKAPWVMVLTGTGSVRFSARNQLTGTISKLDKGAVNTEVAITLPGGSVVHSVITNEAVMDLGLKLGVTATALIKASHVVLGIQD